jgi:hypothetical protein
MQTRSDPNRSGRVVALNAPILSLTAAERGKA